MRRAGCLLTLISLALVAGCEPAEQPEPEPQVPFGMSEANWELLKLAASIFGGLIVSTLSGLLVSWADNRFNLGIKDRGRQTWQSSKHVAKRSKDACVNGYHSAKRRMRGEDHESFR